MRPRQIPRRIPPDAPHYWPIDVGERETWWRLPFPVYVGPLFAAHDKAHAKGQDPLDLALDVYMVLGAAIGLCWADVDQDLETPRSRDVVAYGEAVIEELHEAGWTLAEVAEVGRVILGRLSDSLRIAADEVADRVGFTSVPREAAS
jgi:hypothetical protein